MNLRGRESFTLIELLVVIAILAVLAVAVVLVLNPAQLLAQGRDSTRLSDLSALNSALSLFQADQYTQSLGTPNTLYISVPDNASSSCGSLGLPTPPPGWAYHCVPQASSTKVDGSGWIPVNLTQISSGSPLSKLPIDPANSSSSGLYYTYTLSSNGKYELTSELESQKYVPTMAQDGGSYDGLYQIGSQVDITPPFRSSGLMGYWPFDEGSGTTAYNSSGNNNNGSWSGATPYYTASAKVGAYAGNFNGSNDIVTLPTGSTQLETPSITVSAWINFTAATSSNYDIFQKKRPYGNYRGYELYINLSNQAQFDIGNGSAYITGPSSSVSKNTWTFIVGSYDGNNINIYVNGTLKSTVANNTGISYSGGSSPGTYIGTDSGNANYFTGFMDDVRIYNRALSAAEVQAIYNAQK